MTLRDMRVLIEQRAYRMSSKIAACIEDGFFRREDLEECILTGSITKVQRDEVRQAVDGKKYIIIGQDTRGLPFYTCGKVCRDYLGNYYFFITAHTAD